SQRPILGLTPRVTAIKFLLPPSQDALRGPVLPILPLPSLGLNLNSGYLLSPKLVKPMHSFGPLDAAD
ncbi:MAG: hypothetical protein KJ927_07375, partial [Candidatus Eisenbacteria bacterium]|nr:hypothetical protein [Candidatus Eisenbacteria bacterium]